MLVNLQPGGESRPRLKQSPYNKIRVMVSMSSGLGVCRNCSGGGGAGCSSQPEDVPAGFSKMSQS